MFRSNLKGSQSVLGARHHLNGVVFHAGRTISKTLPLRYAQARQASHLSSSVPRVVQPGIWNSVIPKFMRRVEKGSPSTTTTTTSPTAAAAAARSKEWNPATVFIVMFLLIGSNAINLIALRTDLRSFSVRADAQIRQLQSVVERVQRGEDVDVEKELGTGDEAREKEWEELLKEIEIDDPERARSKKSAPKRKASQDTTKDELGERKTISQSTDTAPAPPRRPATFY